ncbi:hypothetical protein Tco_0507667 [Tanacetum coccineum]
MAARGGRNNLVARRVIDDLIDINGERSPSKYLKIFIEQQITDHHWFIARMRDEIRTSTNLISLLNALIVELEASGDYEEVFDLVMELRDDRRDEQDKVANFNRLIVVAEEKIHGKEIDLEMLEAEGNDVPFLVFVDSELQLSFEYEAPLCLSVVAVGCAIGIIETQAIDDHDPLVNYDNDNENDNLGYQSEYYFDEHIGLKILSWKKVGSKAKDKLWDEITRYFAVDLTVRKLFYTSSITTSKMAKMARSKVKSAAAKMARSKSVYEHTMGRSGYALVKEKMKETEDKIKEGTLKVDHGTDAMTVVLGKENGGYVRGVGSGVTYKRYFDLPRSRQASDERILLLQSQLDNERRERQEKELLIQNLSNKMSQIEGMVTKLKESVGCTWGAVSPVDINPINSSADEWAEQLFLDVRMTRAFRSLRDLQLWKRKWKQGLMENKCFITKNSQRIVYKVSIDTSLVDAACIPDVGNNSFKTVKDAVGGFFAWPKDQVVFDPKCYVNDSHYDMPLIFYVHGRGLHFDRREFSLITGLSITSLDLIGVVEDEELFSKLCDEDDVHVLIMEYLVNISKRRVFWSLNEDILKITILKTNMPYLSRKIRGIRACTHQRPQRKEDQYVVYGRSQYAVLKIMTKVIKGEFEKIKDVMVEDVSLTCDTSLEVFNNEVNRLRGMDEDLFTYEVDIANIPYDSKMNDDSEHEADDDIGYDPFDVAFTECGDDKVELTDEDSSDDKDEVAEVFRIDTNLFNFETPMYEAFKEFNYLLQIYPDLLTKDIEGFKTYKDYKNDWIYEWNKDVPWVDEKPWTNAGDYEWYEALEDSELKDEALRNKAIVSLNYTKSNKNVIGLRKSN